MVAMSKWCAKRVLVKAAEDAGFNLDLDPLPGHIGLVFAGQDPLKRQNASSSLAKRMKRVQVIGGRFEGQLYTGADVETLVQAARQR